MVTGDDGIPIGDGGQYHAGILFDGEGEAGVGGGGDVEAMLSSSRTRCKYASSSSAGGAGVDFLMGRRCPNSSPVIIEHCVHILHDSSTGKKQLTKSEC